MIFNKQPPAQGGGGGGTHTVTCTHNAQVLVPASAFAGAGTWATSASVQAGSPVVVRSSVSAMQLKYGECTITPSVDDAGYFTMNLPCVVFAMPDSDVTVDIN